MALNDPPALSTAASGPVAASAVQPGLPLIRRDSEPSYTATYPALVAVLLIGVLVLWVLKRSGWQQRLASGRPGLPGRKLQVRETVHVSPKVRVSYLQFGEHELLLAHGDQAQTWLVLPGPPAAGAPPEAESRP